MAFIRSAILDEVSHYCRKKVAYLTKVPGHVIFILREKVPYVHLQATVGGSEQYRIGRASYYATAPELEIGTTNHLW